MINLIPTENKEALTYARKNRLFLRWSVALFGGLVGVGLVVLAGFIYINYSTNSYANIVQQNKDLLAAQKLEETKKRLEEISTSTKLVTQVLSREVLFSKLLQGIGSTLPSGAALQNLTIAGLTGAIDLQVAAVDYATVSQVQANLQDPNNKVFEKADLVNVTCTPNPKEKFQCQASIRALFAKNSPYIVTNRTSSGSTKP